MLSVFAQNSVAMTILCAPAGFGKTSALAALFNSARGAGLDPIWLDGFAGAESWLASNVEENVAERHFLFLDNAEGIDPKLISALAESTVRGRSKFFIGARKIDGLRLSRHLAAGDAQLLPPELLLWRRGAVAEVSEAKLTSAQCSLIERLAEGWAAPSMLLALYLSHGGRVDQDGVGLADSLASAFID